MLSTQRVAAFTGAATAVGILGIVEAGLSVVDRSLIDRLGRFMADTAPLPVVEQTVHLAKHRDKAVIRAGLVAGIAGAGAAVGTRAGKAVPATVAAATAASGLAATRWALQRRQGQRRDFDANHGHATTTSPSDVLATDGAEDWPGVAALHTPIHKLFATDVEMLPPLLDPDAYRLTISGGGRSATTFSLDDLQSMPAITFDAALVCIHQRPGWGRVGNVRWTGVPVEDLMAAAGIDGGWVTSISHDGFAISVPLDDPRTILALAMNGRPLTAAHGFPARLFRPSTYGQYAGAKWTTELRIDHDDPTGADYWVRRGWPAPIPPVRPTSRIDHVDRRTGTITGVTWAPPSGVARVEVAVGRDRWETAELARELDPATWRRWRLVTDLSSTRVVRSRATSAAGVLESDRRTPPFPIGAAGLHRVRVPRH